MTGTPCVPCFLVAVLWVGCSGLTLSIPTSPVFRRVGGDVTLSFSLNPSNAVLQAVTWTFTNTTNNVVILSDGAVSYGQGYEGRAHLNNITGFLSLFRLTLNDSGQYSVSIITTEGGSASGSVTLQVLDPVSVPTIQSNVTNPVEFNDTVTLTCTASGSDVSFRWFNGSSEVLDIQRIHLSADNRTLTISGLLRSDDGPFYCYVYNHVSNGTSSPFSLNVKYGPELPILSVSPNKPVYAAGSSLILQCSAQSSPTAQYQWFLNGTSLNKRGQELEIRNIQVDQAGNYTCWAYNNVTLRYAAAHRDIDVIDPVSVPTIQSNVTNPAEFNDTVTLTCTASGSDVSFRWFNGSSEVLDIQRIHLSADNRTLTISGLLRSDDGPFYCYVYNHVSNGTSSPFSLNVKYGPELPILSVSPNKPVYAAGSSLILQCSAQSSPTAQYQWFLNGTSLNKRGQELEIRNIQVDQAGNYTCWAYNNVTLRYAAAHRDIDVIDMLLTTDETVAIAVCCVLLVLAVTALVVFLLMRHRRSSTGASKSSSPTTKPEDALVYSTPTFLKEPGDKKTTQNADPNTHYANISKQPQVQSNTATEYAELRRK